MKNSPTDRLLGYSVTRLLINKNNLLAFSHGLDSTALYHLLKESDIPFDIALVNYGVRPEAEEEEAAARELARRDKRRIFVAHAPGFRSNFEAEARRFRYDFFESLIDEHGYENLLTAHQLNDRLEWMMMRLIRGAGTVELAGMEAVAKRFTASGTPYRLIRPLLETPKYELEHYLRSRGVEWFEDSSNASDTYERNRLRPLLEPLVRRHASGIARSFDYLAEDAAYLRRGYRELYREKLLRILQVSVPSLIPLATAETLKKLSYLPSYKERELLRQHSSLVLGRRWAVERRGDLLFIAPYHDDVTMEKAFRERCRLLNIPPKIRPYLSLQGIEPEHLPLPSAEG
ncbi:tRNA lysidine(34) synthetase TilS [Nitratifractor salsuginis]|uniref:tRNA(Ile)-lysidine synthase n=1 Tax=Nitratifractor salsuginis (strain DSM 16511 / JCM 12458 / E9I37-1) TaxID=749222 RepID=E6X385_NITSE|nr:tRNA lysidine(34) synthetase TilS [Nitratifractor salsuginis]ADV47298.1 tRNA(Ile)-lysidine synthetase [Nitratifractor salsuginis DSM 16511]